MATAQEKKKAEEARAKAASLNPNDMATGGGLLDNIRATIVEAKFEMTDYGGRSPSKRPAAHLILEEPDGERHEDQWWSVGKPEEWMPSDDGAYIIPTGLRKQIHVSSKFGMLTQSALNCGFPEDKFDPDIGFLVGTEAHFQQVATGREKKKSKDGSREYEDTALCMAEIFKFPWEKAGAKSAGAGGKKSGGASTGKGKKAADKDPEPDTGGDDAGGDVETAAQELIFEILVEAGGTIQKKELAAKIMQARKDSGDNKGTNAMMKLAFNDGFLGSDVHPWSYDGGVLSVE